MKLALPEAFVELNRVDTGGLEEHAARVQRNFDVIVASWSSPRTVRGMVDGATLGIIAGSGFTVGRVFTPAGIYVVAFTKAFAATPIIVVSTTLVGSARLAIPAPTGFYIALEDNAGAQLDATFTFIAEEA